MCGLGAASPFASRPFAFSVFIPALKAALMSPTFDILFLVEMHAAAVIGAHAR